MWEESYNDSYGPNWDDQARKARIRDQARCQLCGLTEAKQQRDRGRKLAVHHIRPIRTFRDGEGFDYERANSLSNLMTVCDRCHQRVEQMAPLRPDTAAAAD